MIRSLGLLAPSPISGKLLTLEGLTGPCDQSCLHNEATIGTPGGKGLKNFQNAQQMEVSRSSCTQGGHGNSIL
jgi:hypothetical protein